MFVLKAFASHNRFTSNAVDAVSSVGEISTLSLTYARDKGLYKANAISPDINLIAFTSAIESVQNTNVISSTPYQLPQNQVDDIITIINNVYATSIAAQGVIYRDQLLNDLLTQYAAIAMNFDCGAIVNNGTYFVPEWVSWESKNVVGIGSGNIMKVWLSDPSFQIQYDDFTIVVVPPLTPLDSFFVPSSEVRTEVNAVTPPQMMNRVQDAKGGYPESIVKSMVFNYHDPMVSTIEFPTVWNLLIYGAAGNGVDVIKNALQKYVLANSARPRLDWVSLFPDIFKNTEFTIIPEWRNYAIPNRVLEAGIYSPTSNIQSALNLMNATLENYPVDHVTANACMTSQPYKSLSLLIVGGPDNIGNKFKITDVFPDYIDISTTSTDFSRMSTPTQEWALMLSEMLIVAESMGINTPIPQGMSRVVRNNILYIVSNYNNINYLVAAKVSFP